MADDDSLQERITGFWSTIAAGYEAHEGNMPASEAEHSAWVEAIQDLLPPVPADVLDIGAGTGFLALIASQLGHRVVGIDLSEPMLNEARARARERRLDVRFERRDALDPALSPASYDAIVCRHLLWTLREPETAFRNWRTLLRPGGRVVAIDGHWFRHEPPAGEPKGPELFERHYTADARAALPLMTMSTPELALKLFEGAGFMNVELSYLSHVHARAEKPPSEEPWYVIVARR